MSVSNSPSLIERLPIELLERIFLLTSAQDILRLSSVNHAFHGLVRASPSIQYDIDLFGAGLQHNPRTEKSLADCRKALETYCKRWETLDPAEKWDKVLYHVSSIRAATVVSGTYGILWKNSIKFFTLGSVSRDILGREWDIPLKHFVARTFTFYPQANVVAIVEEVEWTTWLIHLGTLKDGEPHPAAQTKILSRDFVPANDGFIDMSITGSRLAVLRGASDMHTAQVVVWDWTMGQILLELDGFYRSAKFIDDYWLAFILASYTSTAPPELVLLNTDQTTRNDPTPAQTTFHFTPCGYLDADAILYLDQGGHKPSPEESSLAPFHQAASQRTLAIELIHYNHVLVVRTDILLQLARERGGTVLSWGEWKAHTVEVRLGGGSVGWVSGPRLFCMYWPPLESEEVRLESEEVWLESEEVRLGVCDLSPQRSKRDMERTTDGDGVVRQVVRPRMQEHCLPWDARTIHFSNGGHDSIAFVTELESSEDPFTGKMHVWNF